MIRSGNCTLFPVIPGLDPGIQGETARRSNCKRLAVEPWVLGSGPSMTRAEQTFRPVRTGGNC